MTGPIFLALVLKMGSAPVASFSTNNHPWSLKQDPQMGFRKSTNATFYVQYILGRR